MHLFVEPEFWILLAVVAFVIGVWKPARRAILGGLDSRAARIRDELETARRLRDEAQEALAGYQKQQREAAAEAEAIITHAKAEAERLKAEAVKAAADAATAKEEAEKARTAALADRQAALEQKRAALKKLEAAVLRKPQPKRQSA